MKFIYLIISCFVICNSFFAQERSENEITYSQAMAIIQEDDNTISEAIKKPVRNIDLLVDVVTQHENALEALLIGSIAMIRDSSDEIKKLLPMHAKAQKNLLGLKIIQIYDQRKKISLKYRIYQMLCGLSSAASFGVGIGFAWFQNYSKAVLFGAVGLGCYRGEKYYEQQRINIQNLPDPTKAQIYKDEFKPNKISAKQFNRVEAGMQPITLANTNPLAEPIRKIKLISCLTANSTLPAIKDIKIQQYEAIKALRTEACDQRNIDAVLVLTDMLEEEQKPSQ